MGYTPAFDTIYTGTLYGRWPAAPVWASLLPLLDRHGNLDMSVEAICGMTGWPRDLLLEGIRQLTEADPHSRTPGNNGARLVSLVEGRPWGWRAVNHGIYREKARKQLHDERRKESGENAERMASRRAETRDDPTRPAKTRDDPLSDSDPNVDKNKSARAEAAPLVLHDSLPQETWNEWLVHRREKHLSMSPRALNKQLKLLAEYPTAIQREIIDTSINAGWEGLFRPKGNTPKPQRSSEWT